MNYVRLKWLAWVVVPLAAVAGGYLMGIRSHRAAPESEPAEVVAVENVTQAPVPKQADLDPTPEAPVALMATAAGAVLRPGAYALGQDARVQDLIDAAGGLTENALLNDINIAARVVDGSVLTIPERVDAGEPGQGRLLSQPAARLNPRSYTRSGWAPPESGVSDGGAAAGTASTGGLVNLNTATQAQLETLPGVGPVTAGKIIEYRSLTPFKRVEDLVNIHGVGEKTLETLRPLVTVAP